MLSPMSVERDDVAARHDAGALDDALQLPDVARPWMFLKPTQHLVVDALDAPVQLLVEPLDEMAHEQRNVVAALAQRRQPQRDDGQRFVELVG